MSEPIPTVPAGWYPDPSAPFGTHPGVPSLRYFDGLGWTEHRAPAQRRQAARPSQPIIVQNNVHAAPYVNVNYRPGTSHGLHLVLTLLTCGAWLPIWIIMVIVNGGR